MFDNIYAQIWAAIMVPVCGLALWKGSRAEQAGSLIIVMGWLATVFAQQDTATLAPKFVWLGIDTVVFVAFGVLAWRSPRSWPVFATAFQAIAVIVHIASLLNLHVADRAYIAALTVSGYGPLASLAVGTWRMWREQEALNF